MRSISTRQYGDATMEPWVLVGEMGSRGVDVVLLFGQEFCSALVWRWDKAGRRIADGREVVLLSRAEVAGPRVGDKEGGAKY